MWSLHEGDVFGVGLGKSSFFFVSISVFREIFRGLGRRRQYSVNLALPCEIFAAIFFYFFILSFAFHLHLWYIMNVFLICYIY